MAIRTKESGRSVTNANDVTRRVNDANSLLTKLLDIVGPGKRFEAVVGRFLENESDEVRRKVRSRLRRHYLRRRSGLAIEYGSRAWLLD